jgi:transposase-like protein
MNQPSSSCHCPRCGSTATVKNGSVKGAPKHQCKACGFQFTKAQWHGATPQVKLVGVLLYAHGLSMNAIGKLLGFSTPAVLYWIKHYAREHCPKPAPGRAVVVEADEMWHYLEKKLKSAGLGKPAAGPPVAWLIGNAAVVITPPSSGSSRA